MNSGEIHLVLGISCSGKSTYIEHQINGGEWTNLPVLMAYELDANLSNLPDSDCVVHYNLFRPFDNKADNLNNDFNCDSVLAGLLELNERIKATMLIVHPAELSKRILLQENAEDRLREGNTIYPWRDIFELLCRLDLQNFYNQWLKLFGQHRINVRIANAETTDYESIPTSDALTALLNEEKYASYSDQDIKQIINRNDFEYQRIQLGNNLETEGYDRSPSLALLDNDLSGKTVLDIGCAYGFFCFEAEKRNAAKVVGTELKRHRFIGANIVKAVTGSSAEIRYQDIFSEPLNCTFDIVLLLNVLHHLKEPIHALRMIAKLCAEKLIIEFPTLADEKFNSTLTDPLTTKASHPLIGVSLQGEIDQTFLFSPLSIERILQNHEQLFSSIEFIKSPMNSQRCVAICKK